MRRVKKTKQNKKEAKIPVKDFLERKEKKGEKKDLEKLRKDLWAHETASWVLAVLGLILILFLVVYIIWSYVSQKETRIDEIYLQELKSQLGKADFSGRAFFSVPKVKREDYYLAYFPGKAAFVYEGKAFLSTDYGKKHLCICKLNKEEVDCQKCVSININATFKQSSDSWAIPINKEIKIERKKDSYVFSVLNG